MRLLSGPNPPSRELGQETTKPHQGGSVLAKNALVLEVDEKASYMLKLQTHNRQILSVQLQSLNSAQTARYCYDDYDYGVEFFGKVAAMS